MPRLSDIYAEIEVFECDRCHNIFEEDASNVERYKFEAALKNTLFKNRTFPIDGCKETLCLTCLKEVVPLLVKLRDIDETIIYVNYIARCINAIRNKNYWPNANDVSKGGIERLRRNIRNRARISASQTF